MEADELLGPRAQVLAERRLPLLARAQLLLGQQRQVGEGAPAADALAVERRARLEVVELGVERGHAATLASAPHTASPQSSVTALSASRA